MVDLLGVRVKVSVDTAEEHSRQMDQHAASFRASQPMPPPEEEGELLVATADAKGVPMRRIADPAAAPRTAHRRGKGEKAHKKQMAYVGAVYTIARFPRTVDQILDELLRKERAKDRPRPQHKHVWAEMTRPGDDALAGTLMHGPSYLFAGLAVECQQRDPARKKTLIGLCIGIVWIVQEVGFMCFALIVAAILLYLAFGFGTVVGETTHENNVTAEVKRREKERHEREAHENATKASRRAVRAAHETEGAVNGNRAATITCREGCARCD